MNRCGNITDQVLEDFHEAIQRLTSLRSITLYFSGQVLFIMRVYWFGNSNKKITDEGFKAVSQALEVLSSLESITLGFSRMETITDKSLNSLGEAFQKLGSLRNIHLEFYDCGTTEEGRETLKESLQKLGDLKNLRLNNFMIWLNAPFIINIYFYMMKKVIY